MKYFIVMVSFFAIFGMATCRALPPTPADITRDIRVALPGNERIDKRSAEDFIEAPTPILAEIPSDDNNEDDDYLVDYATLEGGPSGKLEALDSSEDFALSESSIVFHPLFVSRKRSLDKNRAARSAEEIQNHGEFSGSVNNNEEAEDELKVAENGMVFLPLFRSRSRFSERQRLRRAVEEDLKTRKSADVIETDESIRGDEDFVFKPSSKRNSRYARSVSGMELSRKADDLVVDMDAAENGLIFRPLFRTRQRGTGSA